MRPTPTVPIGALRERITIQRLGTTPDSQGGQTGSPTTVATVWAAIETNGRAAEALRAGAERAEVAYVVTIRRRTDVTAAMRIVWGTRTLLINGVASDSDRRRMA